MAGRVPAIRPAERRALPDRDRRDKSGDDEQAAMIFAPVVLVPRS